MDNTMNHLSRLLGIAAVGASVGASIAKARLMQRFIKDIANIVTFAIAAGFMVGLLLIGVFYIIYQTLMRYGLDPFAAQIFIITLSAIILIILIITIASRIRNVKYIPAQIVHGEFPLYSRLNELADSFLEGLLDSPRDREK
jgi:hypothetical protein